MKRLFMMRMIINGKPTDYFDFGDPIYDHVSWYIYIYIYIYIFQNPSKTLIRLSVCVCVCVT